MTNQSDSRSSLDVLERCALICEKQAEEDEREAEGLTAYYAARDGGIDPAGSDVDMAIAAVQTARRLAAAIRASGSDSRSSLEAERDAADHGRSLCLHCGLEIRHATVYERDEAYELVARHALSCQKNPLIRERDEARSRVAELEGEVERLNRAQNFYAVSQRVRLEDRIVKLEETLAVLEETHGFACPYCGIGTWCDLRAEINFRVVTERERAALASAPGSGEEIAQREHSVALCTHCGTRVCVDCPKCGRCVAGAMSPAPTPAQETPQETRPITCCTVPGRGKSRTCAQESLKVVFPADSDVQCCCPCHAGHPPDPLPPQPVLVPQKITDHPVLVWYFRGGSKTCFKCHEPVSMHSPAPEPREETR